MLFGHVCFIIEFLEQARFCVDLVSCFVYSFCASESFHYEVDLEAFFVWCFELGVLYIYIVLGLKIRVFVFALLEEAFMDVARLGNRYADPIWFSSYWIDLTLVRTYFSRCSISKSVAFKNLKRILMINR